jgi:hypothetical protein
MCEDFGLGEMVGIAGGKLLIGIEVKGFGGVVGN